MTTKPLSRRQEVMAWLEANPAGATSAEIAQTFGLTMQQAMTVTNTLKSKGLVTSRHDMTLAKTNAHRTQRYYAHQHAPAANPIVIRQPKTVTAPSGPAILTKHTRHTVGPANKDYRYTVRQLPEGYVSQIDSSECSGWAKAVAP